MAGLIKPWLHVVPWETVISINAALCEARSALHKPTSDGYSPAKELWEKNRSKNLSLSDVLQICFQCHRLAPFCNYNGNTFVSIVKTLIAEEQGRLPADKAHILRSIAGHIVAGTATDIERKQLDAMLAGLEKSQTKPHAN
ncbi:MAG TPA: hypothetical protein VFM25_13370 [Verrucomicrobiae bacterium]|nr:hypothetical protein [Verrucomicrobiae bacterium]